MIDWATLLLSPKGRIRRREFWVGLGVWVAASWLAWLIPLFGPVLAYGLTWIWFCVSIKRLHEMDLSGWKLVWPFVTGMTAFVATALVLFGGLVAGFGAFNYPALGAAAFGSLAGVAALAVLADIAWLVWLFRIGTAPGDPEINLYGPPPGQRLLAA